METVRVLSADNSFYDGFSDALKTEARCEVFRTPACGLVLAEQLLRTRTDVLVVDLALPGVDGMDVLDVVSRLPLTEQPLLFAVADVCSPRMVELLEGRLTYCFIKSANARQIAAEIAALLSARQLQEQRMRTDYAMLDRLVTEFLFRLGVSPHLNGYHLLREAVKLVALVKLPSRLSVMQNIYPATAGLMRTSVSMAEHAMRHAIENAWMRAEIGILQRCFGYTVHEMRDTPSNSAFIYMLADRVRMCLMGMSHPETMQMLFPGTEQKRLA